MLGFPPPSLSLTRRTVQYPALFESSGDPIPRLRGLGLMDRSRAGNTEGKGIESAECDGEFRELPFVVVGAEFGCPKQ